MFESDALKYVVSGIIFPLMTSSRQEHPVAFWSQKMNSVEKNYRISEAEMLAIMKYCKK